VGLATDEPLLERLRILVSDTTTDHHVKKKAVELYGSWSVNFKDERGMERIVKLRSQLPSKVSPGCDIDIETRHSNRPPSNP
jgi:hypothetical protein